MSERSTPQTEDEIMLHSAMNGPRTGIKIGTLLIKSGVVRPELISAALQEQSRQHDRRIGSVLVSISELRQQDLTSGLHLQSLVNEGILPLELAIKALNISYKQSIPAAEALRQLNWMPAVEEKPDPVCELMLASGFLSRKLYQQTSIEDRQLSFCFVLRGILSCAHFNEVLRVASLISHDVIGFEDGVDALDRFRTKQISVSETLSKLGHSSRNGSTRIGDILLAAGLISESDLLIGVEQSLRLGQKVGDYLVNADTIAWKVMAVCLQAQTLIHCGLLSKEQAVVLIKECRLTHRNLSEVVSKHGIFRADENKLQMAVELLKTAGIVTQSDVDSALVQTAAFNMGALPALAFTGRVHKMMYESTAAAQAAVADGKFKPEEAIVILQLCDRLTCCFDEAVAYMSTDCVAVSSEQACSAAKPAESQTEIRRFVRDADRKKTVARNLALLVYFIVGTVLVLCLRTLLPNIASEWSYGLIATWLIFCLTRIVRWESQDTKRRDEVELTVQVARRKTKRPAISLD